MPKQLSFDLPPQVRLGPEDYFVSEANAVAYALIRDDGAWPQGKLALIGPAGAGKSHLVRVWQAGTGAEVLEASALPTALPPPGSRIAVEGVDHLPQAAEESLFHLHNHLAATGGRLLLTGRSAPSRWPIALPDLASRMNAATVAEIADPDDRLLAAVLAKLFADRQIVPARDVIPWLVSHLPRAFSAASEAVERLDREALGASRALTRPFAVQVLGED